jgi:hypothetical protein
MNAKQPDDADSGPHEGELRSKVQLNRAVAKLKVYEWERLDYTDAANTAAPGRKPATFSLLTRLKAFLRWIAF